MNNTLRNISAAALLTLVAAPALRAQEQLNKEIVIERDIVLTLDDADRQSRLPQIMAPQVSSNGSLQFADLTTSAAIPPKAVTLDAAAPDDAIAISPYRGYAALGYFPAFNLGASAGYRFISTPATSLGAKLQYDGNSYKPGGHDSEWRLTRHTLSVGADFKQVFERKGRLDVNAIFTYNHLLRPWQEIDSKGHTTAFDIDATWSARNRELAYFVRADWNNFAFCGRDATFSPVITENLNPSLVQNIFTAKGGMSYFLSDVSTLAALVQADVIHHNRYNTLDPTNNAVLLRDGSYTQGLVTILPSYRYRTKAFGAVIGARVQLSAHAAKTFHIAPDVRLWGAPLSFLSLELKVGGGEHINRLASLFDINPYMSPSIAYNFSHVPLTADLAVTVGPWHGASIRLHGGYAIANDWLMPTLSGWQQTAVFLPTNLRAWQAGAEITYRACSQLSASVSYEFTPGSLRHSWYLNPDRAHHVINAAVQVKPIDHLTVDLSYEMRQGRSIAVNISSAPGATYLANLHNTSALNIGATYSLTEQWSVFARLDDILNRRALTLSGLEAQGFRGLLGASYKF